MVVHRNSHTIVIINEFLQIINDLKSMVHSPRMRHSILDASQVLGLSELEIREYEQNWIRLNSDLKHELDAIDSPVKEIALQKLNKVPSFNTSEYLKQSLFDYLPINPLRKIQLTLRFKELLAEQGDRIIDIIAFLENPNA